MPGPRGPALQGLGSQLSAVSAGQTNQSPGRGGAWVLVSALPVTYPSGANFIYVSLRPSLLTCGTRAENYLQPYVW